MSFCTRKYSSVLKKNRFHMSFDQVNQMMGRFSNFTNKTQTHTARNVFKGLGLEGRGMEGSWIFENFTEIPYIRLGKNLVKRYVQ